MHAKARLVPATCNDSIRVQVHVLPPPSCRPPRGAALPITSLPVPVSPGSAGGHTVPSALGVLGPSVLGGGRFCRFSTNPPPEAVLKEGCKPQPGFSPLTTDFPVWIYPQHCCPFPRVAACSPTALLPAVSHSVILSSACAPAEYDFLHILYLECNTRK